MQYAGDYYVHCYFEMSYWVARCRPNATSHGVKLDEVSIYYALSSAGQEIPFITNLLLSQVIFCWLRFHPMLNLSDSAVSLLLLPGERERERHADRQRQTERVRERKRDRKRETERKIDSDLETKRRTWTGTKAYSHTQLKGRRQTDKDRHRQRN